MRETHQWPVFRTAGNGVEGLFPRDETMSGHGETVLDDNDTEITPAARGKSKANYSTATASGYG
jgi:hypothetical protein